MLFDSEPATSPLPRNETPEICLSKAGTIRAGESLGRDAYLESSQFTCMLSNMHVYNLCPAVWT